MCAQGATWAYDWTFGADTDFMQACEDNGVEYMPMIVRYIELCCLWLVYEGKQGPDGGCAWCSKATGPKYLVPVQTTSLKSFRTRRFPATSRCTPHPCLCLCCDSASLHAPQLLWRRADCLLCLGSICWATTSQMTRAHLTAACAAVTVPACLRSAVSML